MDSIHRLYIHLFETKNTKRLSIFSTTSSNLVPEAELLFHYLVIATTIFKITQTLQKSMINSLSSTQMQTTINCIMHNHYTKLECTKKHKKLFNKQRIQTLLREFCNYKLQFNMNLKKLHMQSHLYLRCHLMLRKPQLHKDVFFSKKKNMKKQELSSRKLLTKQGINVTSHITQLFVSIS